MILNSQVAYIVVFNLAFLTNNNFSFCFILTKSKEFTLSDYFD